jgi:uncharacterized protein YndB with AHSA1/START domain
VDPIIIEQTLNATAEDVWKAITDLDEMKKWYFDIDKFKPETGFEFRFEGKSDKCVYIHLCKVTEVIPYSKLSYSWRYEGYPGISLLTFELFPDGNRTRVKLTHDGVETFPQDNPDFAKASFIGGWTYFMGTALPSMFL